MSNPEKGPASRGGDVRAVKDCDDHTLTGRLLIPNAESLRDIPPGVMTRRIVEHHASRAILRGGRECVLRALERAHASGDYPRAFVLATILDDVDWLEWGCA